MSNGNYKSLVILNQRKYKKSENSTSTMNNQIKYNK